MKIKEFDVILCIKKKTEQESFEVVQGDSKSNLVRISLLDGLEPYDLTGSNVEIVFRKADGTTVQQTEQTGVTIINATKGQLQCILKTNTIACPGPVSAEVRVLDTETLLTSSWFDFYVRKSLINDKTIESTDEFPILTQLIADTNGLVGRVEQIEKQVPETVVQRIDDLELNKLNKDGDSSDTTATFEDYSTNIPPLPEAALGNIKTGSKLSVLFSNIKAFCKGAITIGKLANNLSTTAEGLALDARQGKVLNELIGEINSNLAVKADESNTHTYKVTTATALKDIAESGFYRIDAPGLFTDYPSALSTTPYGIVEVSVCTLYKSYCITATDASVTVSKTIHGFSNAGSAIIWGTAM